MLNLCLSSRITFAIPSGSADAVGQGAIVFFVMIIKTKAVTVDELRNLPKGEKLVKVMYKIKLVKE